MIFRGEMVLDAPGRCQFPDDDGFSLTETKPVWCKLKCTKQTIFVAIKENIFDKILINAMLTRHLTC